MDASEVDASETDSVVGDLHEVAMVSDLQVTEEYELGPDDVPPPEDQSELGDESVRGSDDEMDAVNEAYEGETSGEPQALETLHEPIEDMSAQQLTAHTSAVFAVSVNAANPYFFATGGGDDVGYLWRVGLAEPVARLQGHSETISSIGFSADGNYLATGGLDGIVRVWSADAGAPVVALEGPTQGINWVAWHSRGAVLLAGSEDATAWMWKVPEGSVMQIFSAHSGSVSYGGFANGGRNIITASEDGTVRVWNPRAGTVDHCLHASSPQEPYAITCLAAHPSQAVYLFGIETGAVKMAHAETGAPQSGSSTRASPPSRARSQKPPFSAEPLPCRATPPWILAGKVLAALSGHDASVESVGFCDCMPLAATGSMDGKLCIWELNTFSLRHTCTHGAGVVELLWRRQSPLLFSCTVSREIRLWDARSAECLKVLTGHRDAVLCMAIGYAQDATYLISGSDDHTVRVWSIDV